MITAWITWWTGVGVQANPGTPEGGGSQVITATTGVSAWVAGGLTVAGVMLLIAIALAAIRVLRGPAIPDRIIALDVMVMASVGAVAVLAAGDGLLALLDVAVAVSLVAFIGTTAVAWHLGRRAA